MNGNDGSAQSTIRFYGVVGTAGPWTAYVIKRFIVEIMSSNLLHQVLSNALVIVGLATGLFALWKIHRTGPVELLTTYAKLCDECRRGNEPVACPIPDKYRPKDCPKHNLK